MSEIRVVSGKIALSSHVETTHLLFQLISQNVNIIQNDRDGKFKLGKEIEKDVFRLVPRVGQRENLSLLLYRAQNLTISLNLFTNMRLSTPILAVCRTPVILTQTLLTVESLWLSGKASKCGIRRSEVRFLMGTQIFPFVPRSLQDEKHLSLRTGYFAK